MTEPTPREIAERALFEDAEHSARKGCALWVNDQLRYFCCSPEVPISKACWRRQEYRHRAEQTLRYMETGQ